MVPKELDHWMSERSASLQNLYQLQLRIYRHFANEWINDNRSSIMLCWAINTLLLKQVLICNKYQRVIVANYYIRPLLVFISLFHQLMFCTIIIRQLLVTANYMMSIYLIDHLKIFIIITVNLSFLYDYGTIIILMRLYLYPHSLSNVNNILLIYLWSLGWI